MRKIFEKPQCIVRVGVFMDREKGGKTWCVTRDQVFDRKQRLTGGEVVGAGLTREQAVDLQNRCKEALRRKLTGLAL